MCGNKTQTYAYGYWSTASIYHIEKRRISVHIRYNSCLFCFIFESPRFHCNLIVCGFDFTTRWILISFSWSHSDLVWTHSAQFAFALYQVEHFSLCDYRHCTIMFIFKNRKEYYRTILKSNEDNSLFFIAKTCIV